MRIALVALVVQAAIATTNAPRVINLGRTSLAAVTASEVNGSRAMDNPYYGVVNAFDDGCNWIDRINYTYWHGNGQGGYIEVYFDVPATVVSIGTENAPPFTCQIITCDDGGAAPPPPSAATKEGTGAHMKQLQRDPWRVVPSESPGAVPFDPPRAYVKAIRLTFTPLVAPYNPVSAHGQVECSAVYEVRILGWFPAGTVYTVQKPRVLSGIPDIAALVEHMPSSVTGACSNVVAAPASRPAITPHKMINLGRTSLAAVTASGSNGDDGSIDNIYHGVANAFDDGTNWHRNINYTSWLGGRRGSYIEVLFDAPATVMAIETEKSQPFSCKIIDYAGNESFLPACAAQVQEEQREQQRQPDEPAHRRGARPVFPVRCVQTCDPPLVNVRSVRVAFEDTSMTNDNPFVTPGADEVRILGWFPEGTGYTVQQPRVFLMPHHHLVKADLEFTKWNMDPSAKTPRMQETDTHLIYTYSLRGIPMVRVRIDKKAGTLATEAVTRETPVLPELSKEERGRLLPSTPEKSDNEE